jgi:hypothetical protein
MLRSKSTKCLKYPITMPGFLANKGGGNDHNSLSQYHLAGRCESQKAHNFIENMAYIL